MFSHTYIDIHIDIEKINLNLFIYLLIFTYSYCIYIYKNININLSDYVYASSLCPEAFCLKPCTFADCWQAFLLPVSFLNSLTRKSLSVHVKCFQQSLHWQDFSCQTIMFVFSCLICCFLVSMTRKKLLNHTRAQQATLVYFGFWRAFFLSVYENSLNCGKPDKQFACQLIFLWLVDKQKACQWMKKGDSLNH